MFGGRGDDTYDVDSLRDSVVEEDTSSAGGRDAVVTTIDLNRPLWQGVEDLYLTGNATAGEGNGLDNLIRANVVGSTLRGNGGRDTLIGYGGNDILILDNGNSSGGDVAVGGDGTDEVRADDSVAATGLHLNLFAKGTQIAAAQVGLVPNTSAAMEVEMVRGGSGNDWVDATRLGSGESVRFAGLARRFGRHDAVRRQRGHHVGFGRPDHLAEHHVGSPPFRRFSVRLRRSLQWKVMTRPRRAVDLRVIRRSPRLFP